VVRDGGEEQLTDEVVGQVVAAVRPARPGGRGGAWQALEAEREQVAGWVESGLSVVKIADLLARRGVVVPYRTLHRFCVQWVGFGGTATTVRSLTGSRAWSASSTSPGWGWSTTRGRAGAGWRTR
jgi:hypothetical protein